MEMHVPMVRKMMSMQVMTVQIIVFSVLVIWSPDMGFLWCVAGSRIPGLSIRPRSLPAMLCGARVPTILGCT
jgi:hypothetical protein